MSSRYQTRDPDSNTVPLSYARILYANAQATSTDEKYAQEMLFTEYFEQSISHCVSQHHTDLGQGLHILDVLSNWEPGRLQWPLIPGPSVVSALRCWVKEGWDRLFIFLCDMLQE